MDARRKALSKVIKTKSSRNRQARLGVDLVEIKKARDFYRAHRNRLSTYFASAEVKIIKNSVSPYHALAILLAAKEAIYKASEMSWMGPEGFRKIRIFANKNNQLSFRLSGNYKKAFARRPYPSLTFLSSKDYVVAECS